MKVLQLHNVQRQPGGADKVIDREAAALRDRGHRVDQFLVRTVDVQSRGAVHAGVAAFWNREAVAGLRSEIARDRPDIVHLHTPFPVMSPAVIRVASTAGLPVAMTVHSWRLNCVGGLLLRDGNVCEDCVGRKLKLPAIRHRCYHDSRAATAAMAGSLSAHLLAGTFTRHVDRYLALTPFMRERLIAEGIAPDRVAVKPNSAPDPGPPVTDRRRSIVFTGRLAAAKGVETLLEAWRRVDLDLDLRLVIAGDGPLIDTVRLRAEQDPRITAPGWIDGAQVAELIATAAALVIPSTWYEGLPIALTEALAAGTPVIASDIGNFTELITPGVDGTHFRSGDADSLAGAIDWLMRDADTESLQAGARRTYERSYAEGPVTDQLETIYESAIDSRADRGGARP